MHSAVMWLYIGYQKILPLTQWELILSILAVPWSAVFCTETSDVVRGTF